MNVGARAQQSKLRRALSRGKVDAHVPEAEKYHSDRERAAATVLAARKKLGPFAAKQSVLPGNDMGPGKILAKLGLADGIGALIKIASFDLEADGSMSKQEFSRFDSECMLLLEGATSALLNYSVLSSLIMTIFVTIILLHVPRNYEVDGPAGDGLDILGPDAVERSVYADVATFAWPNDATAQRNLRRVFHWIESIVLVSGFSAQSFALLKSTFLYTILTVGLPSVTAKCEYLVDNPTLAGDINNSVLGGGVDLLHMLALPWVVSRTSVVGFIAMIASAVVTHGFFGSYCMNASDGWLTKMFRAQHREAKRVLLRASSAPVTANATVSGTSTSGASSILAVMDLTSDSAEDEAALCRILAKALPDGQQHGVESRELIARRMVAEGFTLPTLRDAISFGNLQDVVASLSLAPSIGLRVGDQLAIATAVRAEVKVST